MFLNILEEPQIMMLDDIFLYSTKDNYEESDENGNQLRIYDDDEDYNKTSYIETIPKYFINKKLWIKYTSLLCSSCGRKINKIPLPIIFKKINTPARVEGEKITLMPNFPSNNSSFNKNDIIYTESRIIKFSHGLFCSITCIGWYLNNVKDENIANKWETKELTLETYEELTGIELYDIPESINYIKLASRSGTSGISDEEFDNLNERKTISYRINEQI